MMLLPSPRMVRVALRTDVTMLTVPRLRRTDVLLLLTVLRLASTVAVQRQVLTALLPLTVLWAVPTGDVARLLLTVLRLLTAWAAE